MIATTSLVSILNYPIQFINDKIIYSYKKRKVVKMLKQSLRECDYKIFKSSMLGFQILDNRYEKTNINQLEIIYNVKKDFDTLEFYERVKNTKALDRAVENYLVRVERRNSLSINY